MEVPTYVFDLVILFSALVINEEQGVTYRKVYANSLFRDLELFGGIAMSQEPEHRDNIHNVLHRRLLQHSYIHSLTGVWIQNRERSGNRVHSRVIT
jgi:hypothetical protein